MVHSLLWLLALALAPAAGSILEPKSCAQKRCLCVSARHDFREASDRALQQLHELEGMYERESGGDDYVHLSGEHRVHGASPTRGSGGPRQWEVCRWRPRDGACDAQFARVARQGGPSQHPLSVQDGVFELWQKMWVGRFNMKCVKAYEHPSAVLGHGSCMDSKLLRGNCARGYCRVGCDELRDGKKGEDGRRWGWTREKEL